MRWGYIYVYSGDKVELTEDDFERLKTKLGEKGLSMKIGNVRISPEEVLDLNARVMFNTMISDPEKIMILDIEYESIKRIRQLVWENNQLLTKFKRQKRLKEHMHI